jgi:hypothetical protein
MAKGAFFIGNKKYSVDLITLLACTINTELKE